MIPTRPQLEMAHKMAEAYGHKWGQYYVGNFYDLTLEEIDEKTSELDESYNLGGNVYAPWSPKEGQLGAGKLHAKNGNLFWSIDREGKIVFDVLTHQYGMVCLSAYVRPVETPELLAWGWTNGLVFNSEYGTQALSTLRTALVAAGIDEQVVTNNFVITYLGSAGDLNKGTTAWQRAAAFDLYEAKRQADKLILQLGEVKAVYGDTVLTEILRRIQMTSFFTLNEEERKNLDADSIERLR